MNTLHTILTYATPSTLAALLVDLLGAEDDGSPTEAADAARIRAELMHALEANVGAEEAARIVNEAQSCKAAL